MSISACCSSFGNCTYATLAASGIALLYTFSAFPALGELIAHFAQPKAADGLEIEPTRQIFRVINVIRSITTLTLLVSFVAFPVLNCFIIPFWALYFASTITLDLIKLYESPLITAGKYCIIAVAQTVLTALVSSILALVFEGLELARRSMVLWTRADVNDFGVTTYINVFRTYLEGREFWKNKTEYTESTMALLRGKYKNDFDPDKAELSMPPVFCALDELKKSFNTPQLITMLGSPETLNILKIFNRTFTDKKQQHHLLNRDIATDIRAMKHATPANITGLLIANLRKKYFETKAPQNPPIDRECKSDDPYDTKNYSSASAQLYPLPSLVNSEDDSDDSSCSSPRSDNSGYSSFSDSEYSSFSDSEDDCCISSC